MSKEKFAKTSTGLAVEIAGLSVDYEEKPILRGINLKVKEGEFCVVVGRSGVGKTTLLNAVAGLVKGVGLLRRPSPLRMVFQEGLLLPWLTVEDNVELSIPREKSTSHKVRLSRAREVLEELEIAWLAKRFPWQISGGERQRVAIARALAGRPAILCCDEPFAQLDVFTREKVQSWLLKIWEQYRTTVIFTTHDLEEALLLGDRVCILEEGVIASEFKVEFSRPRSSNLRYDNDFTDLRKAIHDRIVGGN